MGSAETDRPEAPGLSPSCTILPPWADWQDKWEQMACLVERAICPAPPPKVSWAQASEPDLVLNVCLYVCVGGGRVWGWRLSAQERSALPFLGRLT